MSAPAIRYLRWLTTRSRGVIATTVVVVAAAAYLVVFHLPLHADLTSLLPADAPSVRDAARLADRLPAQDVMVMIVKARHPVQREAAAALALARTRALDPSLVARVDADDDELRAFVRDRQHLFVPLGDLVAARDRLAVSIDDAKLRSNPLFIDLDTEPDATPSLAGIDELAAKRREAEARLGRSAFVSADGRNHVLVIRTAFRATDVALDRKLMSELHEIARELQAAHPGVEVGFAGGVPVTIAEHAALARGIVLSTAITTVLVALVLFAYFRSIRLLVLLSSTTLAGTLLALASAVFSVGHLNAATAFLGAIIAGNGVNYCIVLLARYREELRASSPEAAINLHTACGGVARSGSPDLAMAIALRATVMPTLVASIGAAIAYAALAATEFRGFADFALIGGVGMVVCWACAYVVLPVVVLRFAPTGRVPSDVFGRIVVRTFGVRPAAAAGIAIVAVVGSAVVAWRFVANDPYEYEMTELRSRAPDAVEARRWMAFSDEQFGRGLAGLGGQTYIAVERHDQVPPIVEALRHGAARDPILGPSTSILDVVPADQDEKLVVLAELRRMIDDVAEHLPPEQRGELLAARPPDELAAITVAALPAALATRLTERDGRVGLVVAVRPGEEFDEFDGRDLIAFAGAVRDVTGTMASATGASLLFSDVLTQIQSDGPLVTGIAAIGIIVMVLLAVGLTRRAVAAIAATLGGAIAMVAACALAGLEITFLDFISLPITLGLGVDYAINVAARADESDPLAALRSTGGAVLVCSMTTIIGYVSLLASDNLAIRGFGIASLIGELTCMAAAFLVVPVVIAAKIHHRGPFSAIRFA